MDFIKEASLGSNIHRPTPIVSTPTMKLSKVTDEISRYVPPCLYTVKPLQYNSCLTLDVFECDSSDEEVAPSCHDESQDPETATEECSDARHSSKTNGTVNRSQSNSKCEAKSKRVLSSNALATLSTDPERSPLSPKRMKQSLFCKDPAYLPDFCLGIAALEYLGPYPARDTTVMFSDDEWDRRLSEELDSCGSESSRENSPVPLLTPPQSPLTINLGGGITTVCEWPSNLVVDSVMMTAATELRVMSPTTLQNLERDEFENGMLPLHAIETSSLTPLFRSIYVGND